MTGPFIVMSRSRIKTGKAEDYAALCAGMVREIEENEPRLLAFNIYESGDHASSAVVQVHPDAESFEYHLKLFGEKVRETFDYADLESIEIFGPATTWAEEAVAHGSSMPVIFRPLHRAGFTRLQGA